MAGVDFFFSMMDTLKTILIYGWPFMILIWIVVLKLIWKKWPVEAVIIEKRGNNLIKTNDRAGKYTDAFTGMTGYKLQKNGDTIPVINFEWVLHNSYKATNLFERFVHLIRGDIGTIFLFKYGSKQYKPIKVNEDGHSKVKPKLIKDSNGLPLIVYVYQQFDPRDKLGALDFEVVDWDNMNFMVQEQRASIERRKKSSDFWKMVAIPAIIIGVCAIVGIVMMKFSMDHAATLGGQVQAQKQSGPAETPNIPIISDVIPGK